MTSKALNMIVNYPLHIDKVVDQQLMPPRHGEQVVIIVKCLYEVIKSPKIAYEKGIFCTRIFCKQKYVLILPEGIHNKMIENTEKKTEITQIVQHNVWDKCIANN